MSHRRSGSAVRARTYSSASGSAASGPPSPTFTATTNASQIHLDSGPDTIITRRDLRQSVNAYEDLVSDCQAYRNALKSMAMATSRFASTFERCSRLKGVDDQAAVGLQAAGGLHHLMGNHWQILDRNIQTGFEDPLRAELQHYKKVAADRSAAYEKTLVEKSKIIKKTEAESVATSRRKQRDLQAFRKTLSALQAHVDDLDRLKAQHYQEIFAHEIQVWNVVMDKTSLVVRSSLDIFERLSAKSSDPMLEPLMNSIPDPFDAYGSSKSENQIFSILPPLAILSHPSLTTRGPSPSPPIINGHAIRNGNSSLSNNSYVSEQTSSSVDSQGWGDGRSISPASSVSSRERDSPTGLPPRRPSSPPSTGTLRNSGGKARPTLVVTEDVLSTGTIRGVDTSIFNREGSSRRDTIIAGRPQRPMPNGEESLDDTVRIIPYDRDSSSTVPTPRKTSFANTFSRMLNPSTSGAS